MSKRAITYLHFIGVSFCLRAKGLVICYLQREKDRKDQTVTKHISNLSFLIVTKLIELSKYITRS